MTTYFPTYLPAYLPAYLPNLRINYLPTNPHTYPSQLQESWLPSFQVSCPHVFEGRKEALLRQDLNVVLMPAEKG